MKIDTIEDIVVDYVNQLRSNLNTSRNQGEVLQSRNPRATDNMHPWDMPVDAEPGNPLGSSARVQIAELRRAIENMQRDINERARLLSEIRAKNTELEARNTALNRYADDLNAVRNEELGAQVKQVTALKEQIEKRDLFAAVTTHYQVEVTHEIDRLWGSKARNNITERCLRFLEEAIELVQACQLPSHNIQYIVDWVYSRPKGPIDREVGGTMVTLAGLCARIGVSLPEAAHRELTRLQHKEPEEMQGRHIAKPESIRTV